MRERFPACGTPARLWALALLCGLLAACRAPAQSPGETGADAAPAAETAGFSLVTLNIYHDKADWPKRRELIVAGLRRLRPDAIALQEVLQDAGLPNQAGSIAQALGYDWHFVSTDAPGQVRRYGNALLTRHPILARGERKLRPYDDTRTAGHLRIDVRGRPLSLYVTHLHWTPEGGAIRERQLRDLLDFVDATRGDDPVAIAGDFNAEAGAPELAPLRADYADAYGTLHPQASAQAASTVNPAFFDHAARIDHVFHRTDGLRAETADIVLDRSDSKGIAASDHFGVQVRLRFLADERAPSPQANRLPNRVP